MPSAAKALTSETAPAQEAGAAPRAKDHRGLRLVQLTDPHLFADPQGRLLGMTTRRSFEAVLEFALARESPIDALVLTGDLVHDASAQGYRTLRGLLDRTELPYYCIPGNHDSAERMADVLGPTVLEPVDRRRLGDWNLVFLDSTEPGREGGNLGQTRLAALADLLSADAPPTLIFLHHQPVPVNSRWIDTMAVLDGQALIGLCHRHPYVKAIVCGHIHQEFALQLDGCRILGTPSTCFQFTPEQDDFAIDPIPPGYRELRLYPDGDIQTTVIRLIDYPERPDPSALGY